VLSGPAPNSTRYGALHSDPSGVKDGIVGTYSGPMIVLGAPFSLKLVGVAEAAVAALQDMVVLVHYELFV